MVAYRFRHSRPSSEWHSSSYGFRVGLNAVFQFCRLCFLRRLPINFIETVFFLAYRSALLLAQHKS